MKFFCVSLLILNLVCSSTVIKGPIIHALNATPT